MHKAYFETLLYPLGSIHELSARICTTYETSDVGLFSERHIFTRNMKGYFRRLLKYSK
jgi:hypothetical protein